jgi:hypothetical protein
MLISYFLSIASMGGQTTSDLANHISNRDCLQLVVFILHGVLASIGLLVIEVCHMMTR